MQRRFAPSRHAPTALFAAALVVSGLATATAQEVVPALVAQARVRVTAPGFRGQSIVGRLVSLQADSVLLLEEGAARPTALPMRDVRTLEVSRGMRRQTTAGAVSGAVLGGIAGLVIGNAAADRCRRSATFLENLCDMDVGVGLFGGIGGGALVGGLVGSLVRVEQWQTVPRVPPSLHVMVSPGRVGVVLSLTL